MMRQILGSCSIPVWIMACLLQAASAVKLVDATLLGCDKNKIVKEVLKPS